MPKTLYSYHFKRDIPLLTEIEWAKIHKLLKGQYKDVMTFRHRYNSSLEDALKRAPIRLKALDKYEEITGERLTGYMGAEHPDLLYKVRLAHYGSPCPNCAKPFRTPRAKMCAECGYELPEGQTAGPA